MSSGHAWSRGKDIAQNILFPFTKQWGRHIMDKYQHIELRILWSILLLLQSISSLIDSREVTFTTGRTSSGIAMWVCAIGPCDMIPSTCSTARKCTLPRVWLGPY